MRFLLALIVAVSRELLARHGIVKRREFAPYGYIGSRVVRQYRYDRSGDTRFV